MANERELDRGCKKDGPVGSDGKAKPRIEQGCFYQGGQQVDPLTNRHLDILIATTPETTLMDVATIQVKLQRLLGVSVDVLTTRALPDSIRNRVLTEAVPV